MRKFLLLLFLIIATESYSQNPDPDSAVTKSLYDSLSNTIPAPGTKSINEDIDRNMSAILELQNKRKAKEKRGAIIRICIGIGFLVILIIGLSRKRK